MTYNTITKKWESQYWHPTVTTDSVVLGFDNEELNILLIKRNLDPFKDTWALPGGFLREDDMTAKDGAYRELKEETSIKLDGIYLEEFKSYSDRYRDPRERVITIAFLALVQKSDYINVKGADDAKEAKWFSIKEIPELAFDHKKIVEDALESLKRRIHFEPIAFHLLNNKFTLSQLQNVYIAILNPPEGFNTLRDRRNFPRKIAALRYIKPTGEKLEGTPYKAPELYTFDEEEYQQVKDKGLWLEL